jgi:hypothetical protein
MIFVTLTMDLASTMSLVFIWYEPITLKPGYCPQIGTNFRRQ